ncbi:MAG: sodium:solute symporter family protein [Myxococcota bacterium]
MSGASFGVAALLLYLALLLGVAEIARRARKSHAPSDHFLAGRELGVFVLFLTLYATAYSGNSLLGYPAEAYRRGYSWIMATGFMMAIIVAFHSLVPGLRPVAIRHGFVTPGDWIRFRFQDDRWGMRLRVAVSVLMTIALANFLLAQLMAMGHVTSQITADAVPYWGGVLGLAAVILLYETVGGMRAVAWTDAAQSILMLVGLAALLGWLVGSAGGLEAVTLELYTLRPDAVQVPDARECANWVSTIVLLGLASIVYPQAIQRLYAARDGKSLRRSLSLMAFMPLTTTLVVTLIGIAAIGRFEHLGTLEADRVMPRLLSDWAATGMLGSTLSLLVFLGALAAIMSTADSVLLSLGSVVAQDFLGRSRLDASTTQLGKRIAAFVMGGATLLALFPLLTLWRLIELKMELLIQCAPAFVLAIHWRRLSARAAFLGLVAGTGVAVGSVLLGVKRIEGVHVGVVGLLVNLGVALVVSAVTPRDPPAQSR